MPADGRCDLIQRLKRFRHKREGGRRRSAPLILHLGTTRSVVTLISRPLLPPGKEHRSKMDKCLGEHKEPVRTIWSIWKSLSSTEIRTPYRPDRNVINIYTVLLVSFTHDSVCTGVTDAQCVYWCDWCTVCVLVLLMHSVCTGVTQLHSYIYW